MDPEKLTREWLTLGIRLSLFPGTRWEAPKGLWEDFVGEPPEAEQAQPRQQLRVQTGPWHGGVLQLSVNPVSIVLAAVPSPGPDGLPDVDSWPVSDIVPAFAGLTQPWLTSTDLGFKRIGFGLNAVLTVDDRKSGCRILKELIGSLRIDPDQMSDLFYQINRPVRSQVLGEGIKLNRLMKWSSPIFRTTAVQVTQDKITEAGLVAEKHYVALDNDVNTPAERTETIEKRLLGRVYHELIELAWKNLEFGELAP